VYTVAPQRSEYLHGECHSAIRKQQSFYLGHQRNVINQCYTPSGESFGDLVASGAVRTRVLRHNSEYLHGGVGHSAIKKQSLPGSSKECYTSVLRLLVSHLWRPEWLQVQCAYSRVAPQRYLHGECWSLSNQEATTCLGHQRNV
jgi:hypothetical protein